MLCVRLCAERPLQQGESDCCEVTVRYHVRFTLKQKKARRRHVKPAASLFLHLTIPCELYVYLYFESSFSGNVSLVVDGVPVKPVKQSTRYYALIPSISAHQLNESHTIVVTTDFGTASISVSPLDYIRAMIGEGYKKYNRDAVSAYSVRK